MLINVKLKARAIFLRTVTKCTHNNKENKFTYDPVLFFTVGYVMKYIYK